MQTGDEITARPAPPSASLRPTPYEKLLALGSAMLFALVAIALAKGRGQLTAIDPAMWAHLATAMLALAITPVQLLRRHGDNWHRILGWVWALSLIATALVSFAVRTIAPGRLSFIHIFSIVTLVAVPLLVLLARRHNVARHRRAVRGVVTGALLAAGYFTLLPSRMLGQWLWG